MGPFLVALQLVAAPPDPGASAAPPAPPPTVTAPDPSGDEGPAGPPPSGAPAPAEAPAPQPVPYVSPSPPVYAPSPPVYAPSPPVYAPIPPYAYPSPPRQIDAPPPEPPTRWFARLELGVGPPAFSKETELLRLEGYGGLKAWFSLDGAYMLHENVGLGAFAALSTWSSAPDGAPGMAELAYFVGAEVPIKLGSRAVSVLVTPRVGYATGQIQFTGDAPFQSALALGADVGVFSLKYHFGGSIGFLRAAVPPPGAVGRDHDYGGLRFMLGGILDG